MFAVKPYYLSNSGTIDYSQGYTFSYVQYPYFNLEVPLASSIESTMEWCNRVGQNHHWIDLNSPLFDVSGFYWLHYDGKRDLKRVVPSATSPYQITGDNTLGSGFYLRYRDIVKFMGQNNMAEYGFPDGSSWSNMEIGGLNWTPIEYLNPSSGMPKISSPHYHQYIYRGGSQTPFWFNGVFYKQLNSYTYPTSPVNNFTAGWDDPLTLHISQMANISGNWPSMSYSYVGTTTFHDFIAKIPDLTNLIPPSASFESQYSINTYFNFLRPPATQFPFRFDEEITDSRIIGFSHTKGGGRSVSNPYEFDFSWPYGHVSGYKYSKNYTSGNYYSEYTQIIENSFWAGLYPLDINVTKSQFANSINKKLIHLLGENYFTYETRISGINSGYEIADSGEFWGFRSGTLADTFPPVPITGLLPTWDYKTEYSCTDDWSGKFKLAYGFIQMSGSTMITGYPYSSIDYTEAATIGNKVAAKIRNNQYIELFNFIPQHPSGNKLGIFYTPPSSIVVDLTSIHDIYSSGDNVVFLSIFYSPFEGFQPDFSPYYGVANEDSLESYIYPPLGPTVTFSAFGYTESIKRLRKGQLCQMLNIPRPSSINLGGTGRLLYSNEWW